MSFSSSPLEIPLLFLVDPWNFHNFSGLGTYELLSSEKRVQKVPKLRAKRQAYLLIDKIVENGIKFLAKALLRLTAVWRKVSIFDYSLIIVAIIFDNI